MALVNMPGTVTYTLQDISGSKSNFQVQFPAATTVADVRTAAGALYLLLPDITTCAVLGYSISYPTFDDAAAAPDADSRVERKAVFQFRTAAGKTVSLALPGIEATAVLASGRVDEDITEVAAVVTNLLGAPWTDSNGSDLSALLGIYERFRGTSKGWMPRDRVAD